MKIEKISETQIRVTLDPSDLQNRNIKIGELAYGSSKAQALFKDMMSQAYDNFGFETENVPLMIEAVPLSTDSIMIVITKVEDPSQIDEKLDGVGERPTHRTFKEPLEDRLTDLELMGTPPTSDSAEEPVLENKTFMYCFKNFDDICSAAHYINHIYFGDTSLYKYGDRYFMIFQNNEKQDTEKEVLFSLLSEFGDLGLSSDLNESFLLEHGKTIIPTNAIDLLTKHL
ncbi:MAG: adaptor protein MecA [Cellulosilyticaceae bacterium]